MNHEKFATVVREDDTDQTATIDDFAVEELEDRLELGCWDCHTHGGKAHCVPIICPGL